MDRNLQNLLRFYDFTSFFEYFQTLIGRSLILISLLCERHFQRLVVLPLTLTPYTII